MSAFGWKTYGDGRTPPPRRRRFGTALASRVGGSPTTTYAENIGVMATHVYSTAARNPTANP